MYENKSLQLAVLVSLLLHFALFLSTPYIGPSPVKEPITPIKVAYIKQKDIPRKLERLVGKKPSQQIRGEVLPPMAPESLPGVTKDDIANPVPFIPPSIVSEVKPQANTEPTVETIESGRAVIGGKGKKFEAVINDEKDNVKKATYIGYYRSVRERIRYYADRNYLKEGSASQGEVFLSFTVTSSGELLHIMIIDKRSINDPLLRNIAINSIRDASPFPEFPQGMSQYQVTFNVIISFELNK